MCRATETVGALLAARPSQQGKCRVLLVGCLALLLLGCSPARPTEQVAVYTASVRALYPQALQVAREWRTDAYLVFVHTDFAVAGQGEKNLFSTFTFSSLTTPAFELTLIYEPATDSFETSLSGYGPERRLRLAIAEDEWPVDSTMALEIAQASGGADFLSRASQNLSLHMSLEKGPVEGTQVTYWLVYYADWTKLEGLCLTIHAGTGAVISRKCKSE